MRLKRFLVIVMAAATSAVGLGTTTASPSLVTEPALVATITTPVSSLDGSIVTARIASDGEDTILEAAAIGIPDTRSGEIVKVFVVRKDPNLTEEDVLEHLCASPMGLMLEHATRVDGVFLLFF